MKRVDLPIFGIVNLQEEDSEYQARIWKYNFEGIFIDLDVHFKEISEQSILFVREALNDLQKLNKIGTDTYLKDFEESELVKDYILEWEQDIFEQILEEEDIKQLLKGTDETNTMERRLLSIIKIVRIGIYAESGDSSIILDYAFGYDHEKGFRDDMIVIKLNKAYQVTEITTEG